MLNLSVLITMKKQFTIFTILLSYCFTSAQTIITNGTQIGITSGALLSVTGNGTVTNNGLIQNNGTLAIAKDWQNQSTYEPGVGTFRLTGNSSQQINHNNQAFFNLSIEDGGQKFINDNVFIYNNLTLQKGLVTPANSKVLEVVNGATITGGSDSSFIDGFLYHEGTGEKFFPVGRNGIYRPVYLTNVQGTTPVVGIEMVMNNPNITIDTSLFAVSNVRYWRKTVLSGNYIGSPIRLSYGNDDMILDTSMLVVAEANDLITPFKSLSRSNLSGNITSGWVTSAGSAQANIFALGFFEAKAIPMYIPNALSPIATNPEDKVIKIYNNRLINDKFLFRVYNNWGQLVYENKSLEYMINIGWDGINYKTHNRETLGLYKYVISGKLTNGKDFEKRGVILIQN